MEIKIRYAKQTDLHDIVEIYNQAIRSRNSIAYLEEFTVDDRKEWFFEHSEETYPLLVAEQNNKVIGWICISPYRAGRKALDRTVLVSYFIHNEFQRKGIGSRLLHEMIIKARELGYKTIMAIIFHINIGSIKILERHQFEQWGFMPDVGEIDGNELSHIYYGRKL